jgi:hypothetical protein
MFLDCNDIGLCLRKPFLGICSIIEEGGTKPEDSFVDAELCVAGGDGQIGMIPAFEETVKLAR